MARAFPSHLQTVCEQNPGGNPAGRERRSQNVPVHENTPLPPPPPPPTPPPLPINSAMRKERLQALLLL